MKLIIFTNMTKKRMYFFLDEYKHKESEKSMNLFSSLSVITYKATYRVIVPAKIQKNFQVGFLYFISSRIT